MSSKRRGRISKYSRGVTQSNSECNAVPDIYQEMLAQAASEGVTTTGSSSTSTPPAQRKRPNVRKRKSSPPIPNAVSSLAGQSELKKPRIAEGRPMIPAPPRNEPKYPIKEEMQKNTEKKTDFEDIYVQCPLANNQLVELASDESDDEDIQFEDVDLSLLSFDPTSQSPDPGEANIELNLTKQLAKSTTQRYIAERRRTITRAEKAQRVEVHKIHILCLFSHVARRNHWCNDGRVQDALRILLTDKIVKYLNPSPNLSQFGRSESLKNGVKMAMELFALKFKITEKGLRRALWAENPTHLDDYKFLDDFDSTRDRANFISAAKSLEGSRDVGAQLFCALLRGVGVKARLVCSLQVLPFATGAPTMARPVSVPPSNSTAKNVAASRREYKVGGSELADAVSDVPNVIQRLGSHRAGLDYDFVMSQHWGSSGFSQSRKTPHVQNLLPPKKFIKESPFPVYWIEVLDAANQKWQPVDPLVTHSHWKPIKLEPPASDRENCLAYVIAFENDGSARDVTRRYAKAYNAKTRRLRLEGLTSPTPGTSEIAGNAGSRWLCRVLRHFCTPAILMATADENENNIVQQIENIELRYIEEKESMPRNLSDFKDHPTYALERHLRQCEVLIPGAQPSGTVGAGQTGNLERVYRRKDVRVARSKAKWFRLGRVVKEGEQAVKILPAPTQRKKKESYDEKYNVNTSESRENIVERTGTAIFTLEQTKPYIPEPVRDGRVPKNEFGNIEIFTETMIPEGGKYVDDEMACRAAYLLEVDYAPALVGFRFDGRKGNAVLRGAVVTKEHADAVRAVCEGYRDLEDMLNEQRKTMKALKTWAKFLRGLRIRARIFEGSIENSYDCDEAMVTDHLRRDRRERVVADEDDKKDGQDNTKAPVTHDEKNVGTEWGLTNNDEDGLMREYDSDEGGGFVFDEEEGGFFLE